MSSPFTCIERLFGFLLLLMAAAPLPAQAQLIERALMPGKVIEGHAKYEQDCEQCHRRFDKGAQSGLCLDCHKAVAADIRSRTRLHGRLDDRTCRNCHTDHKGRDANIAPLDRKRFDHDRTEYRLVGAHRETKCEACHPPSRKYRDAPRQCNGCHEKIDHEKGHKGHLGAKCADCHNERDWKDARFDHEKTRFSLRGKHVDAKCADCHEDRTYRNTPRTCVGCHRDEDREKGHKGRYGAKCESCHTDRGWKPSTFDHDADTKYPLKAKHRPVKCAACHLPERSATIQQDKPGKACVACHRQDDREKGHRGELGEKCEQCHDERGWKSSASGFDHDETRFPLVDKHLDVRCDKCHAGGLAGAGAHIKVERTCHACHRRDDEDKAHKGRYGERCDSCHSPKGWKSSRFDHLRDAKYALLGAHARTKCDACHLPEKGPLHKAKLDTACASCHRKDDKHKGQLGARCESCHDERKWTGKPFDHDRARFPLTGSHVRLECAKCHRSPAFRDAPSTCNGCHEKDDRHKGVYGAKCETCHYTGTWKSWDFDHAKTRFGLEGAHQRAACASCHRGTGPSAAKPPRSCVACHASDDAHDGGFGAQCERCHSATEWRRLRR